MSDRDDDLNDLVADFIRRNGITRIPVAGVAAPSSHHLVGDEAREFHASRGVDPVGDIWRAAHPKRTKAQRLRTLARKASVGAFRRKANRKRVM